MQKAALSPAVCMDRAVAHAGFRPGDEYRLTVVVGRIFRTSGERRLDPEYRVESISHPRADRKRFFAQAFPEVDRPQKNTALETPRYLRRCRVSAAKNHRDKNECASHAGICAAQRKVGSRLA